MFGQDEGIFPESGQAALGPSAPGIVVLVADEIEHADTATYELGGIGDILTPAAWITQRDSGQQDIDHPGVGVGHVFTITTGDTAGAAYGQII